MIIYIIYTCFLNILLTLCFECHLAQKLASQFKILQIINHCLNRTVFFLTICTTYIFIRNTFFIYLIQHLIYLINRIIIVIDF